MIPRTFLSTYAFNNQQQMAVVFLTDITGLKRWADYIPVKLEQGGSENSYANNGYVDVVSVVKTSTMRPFAEYVPVYVDNSASDAWQINATGYIPYGFAGFGDASMVLDFTNGAALDSRVTFTRASTATRTNASGIIESVSTNTARFDYDPVTLAPKGLLIEEQRTNLLLQSESFISPWVITSGFGSSTSGLLTEFTSGASNQASFNQQMSFTSGVAYTGHMDVEYVDRQFVQLIFGAAGFGAEAYGNYDLVNGVVGTKGTTTTNTTITPLGSNRFRIAITASATGTATTAFQFSHVESASAARAPNITLSGKKTQLLRAQVEAGAFATSYIPTTTATVTRAADVATMIGANFSNWYRQDEGTLFVNAIEKPDTATRIFASITDGTTEGYAVATFSNTGRIRAQNVSSSGIGTTITGQSFKIGYSFESGAQSGSLNGSAIVTTTTTVTVVPTMLRIGCNQTANSFWNSHISRIAYYPRRLSNAELQGITS